jgi:EmrB/QacA subfamily drug resistance transporter
LDEESDVLAASTAERRKLLLIIGALMLGMMLASLDSTIVATALPTIAGDLHGVNHYSWVVTAYLLTLTISTPPWGKLGDLYGRKKLYQAAILIFLTGSILAGLSQSIDQLVAFRALQGIGAGGLMVGSQAIIGDVLSPRQRGRYSGYFSSVFAFTSIAGPLLGGLFTEHLGWRWIFYINIPVGGIALLVIASVLRIPKRRTDHRIDYLGTAVLGAAVSCVVLGTTWGGTTYPWSSGVILGLAIGAIALVSIFLLIESRAAEPLVPLSLFRSRVFSISITVGFLMGFVMYGLAVYLPLFFQLVHGATPISSGLQLIPFMICIPIGSVFSGRLITRWGRYKVFPLLGSALMTVGLYLFSLMTPTTPWLFSSLFMVLTGVGLGFLMQTLMVITQNAALDKHLGAATSAATFFRSVGGLFGVSLFGAAFTSHLAASLPDYIPRSSLAAVKEKVASLSPTAMKSLPPRIHADLIQAFSHALSKMFLIGVPFGIMAFVLTLLLEEIPLRERLQPSSSGAGLDPSS